MILHLSQIESGFSGFLDDPNQPPVILDVVVQKRSNIVTLLLELGVTAELKHSRYKGGGKGPCNLHFLFLTLPNG